MILAPNGSRKTIKVGCKVKIKLKINKKVCILLKIQKRKLGRNQVSKVTQLLTPNGKMFGLEPKTHMNKVTRKSVRNYRRKIRESRILN